MNASLPRGRVSVPRPLSPHPDSLQDGRSMLGSRDGTRLAVFCRRNATGAVYFVEAQTWAMYCPISAGAFLDAIANNGFLFPAREITRAWLDHIAPPQPEVAEKVLDLLYPSANDERPH